MANQNNHASADGGKLKYYIFAYGGAILDTMYLSMIDYSQYHVFCLWRFILDVMFLPMTRLSSA